MRSGPTAVAASSVVRVCSDPNPPKHAHRACGNEKQFYILLNVSCPPRKVTQTSCLVGMCRSLILHDASESSWWLASSVPIPAQVYEFDGTMVRLLNVSAAVGNTYPGFIVASVRVLPAAFHLSVPGVELLETPVNELLWHLT